MSAHLHIPKRRKRPWGVRAHGRCHVIPTVTPALPQHGVARRRDPNIDEGASAHEIVAAVDLPGGVRPSPRKEWAGPSTSQPFGRPRRGAWRDRRLPTAVAPPAYHFSAARDLRRLRRLRRLHGPRLKLCVRVAPLQVIMGQLRLIEGVPAARRVHSLRRASPT